MSWANWPNTHKMKDGKLVFIASEVTWFQQCTNYTTVYVYCDKNDSSIKWFCSASVVELCINTCWRPHTFIHIYDDSLITCFVHHCHKCVCSRELFYIDWSADCINVNAYRLHRYVEQFLKSRITPVEVVCLNKVLWYSSYYCLYCMCVLKRIHFITTDFNSWSALLRQEGK